MVKKILLVEDHMTTRRGTRAIVEEDSNFKVVAETGLAAEVVPRGAGARVRAGPLAVARRRRH